MATTKTIQSVERAFSILEYLQQCGGGERSVKEIADALEIHKSTVSRAIRDKYLRAPSGCFLFRSLFTTGIPSGDGNGDVSRNAVKAKLKELIAAEDKKKPWSDEQLAGLL